MIFDGRLKLKGSLFMTHGPISSADHLGRGCISPRAANNMTTEPLIKFLSSKAFAVIGLTPSIITPLTYRR
jgi:hypothetical protein